MEKFDLTTNDGLTNGRKYLEFGLMAASPAYWVYKLAKSFLGSAPTPEQQRKTAEDLIKAGRDNGVDEMEIEINKEAGIKLKSKLEKDCDIETFAGRNDAIKMKVKYK